MRAFERPTAGALLHYSAPQQPTADPSPASCQIARLDAAPTPPDADQPARESRFTHRPAVSTGAHAVGTTAIGSLALPAIAIAIGALAVGAVAIGRLAIGRARIRRLEIDDLVIRRLRLPSDRDDLAA